MTRRLFSAMLWTYFSSLSVSNNPKDRRIIVPVRQSARAQI